MENNFSLSKDRQKLIERLENEGYIESERVKQAFLNVPREEFIPENKIKEAYADIPLNIGKSQTISAPHIIAVITELLDISKDDKVLEIGTGSGYHLAITAELAKKVYSIEIHRELAKKAKKTLNKIGYKNIEIEVGDGSLGLPENSPYDKIYFTCAAPEIPQNIIDQLSNTGKIVAPIGIGNQQTLYVLKKENGKIDKKPKMGVRFVPLKGEKGF